jgi:ubiquinol-cytochrome c reductase cytochrome b subunit
MGAAAPPPRGGLSGFLEDRLGLLTFFRGAMTEKRPPAGIGYLRTLGFAALTVLALQTLSGVALAFHYVPSADLAYDSIRALEQDVPGGAFIRSLHHFGASAFVVLAFVHLLRVFFTGAYKAPRELTWLTGVLLFAIVLAFGFTGYLLPWDQKAFFATKVGTEIAGKAPLVGPAVRQVLNGGDEVGPPTLTRFYVIHVVLLPLALFGLLGAHLFLIQRHGVAPPGRPVHDPGAPGDPYFPHHTAKEALVGALAAAVLFALAAGFRAPLEAPAEPADTGYDPRPDWYFAGLFQLLKLFGGPLEPLGTFWLPNVVVLLLLALPFLDRNPERSWRRRPVAVGTGIVLTAAVVALTVAGLLDRPRNEPQLEYALGLTDAEKAGYRQVRRLKCTECHAYRGIGKTEHDAPDLDRLEQTPEDIASILADPKGTIESEDMPAFDHVSLEGRLAVGLYLQTLRRDKNKATSQQSR